MTVAVRPAAATEIAAAVGVLARAFHEHPVYRDVLPDDAVRRRRLPGLMYTAVVTRHGDDGPLDVALDGGAPVGVAAWHRPDATGAHGPRLLRAVVGTVRATRTRFPRFTALGRAIGALRPDEPHWYLFHVGVEPAHRGAGVGTALIEYGLARTGGLAVHLECAPDLVGYYARSGFVEGGPVPLEGLDLVTMTRPAGSPAS